MRMPLVARRAARLVIAVALAGPAAAVRLALSQPFDIAVGVAQIWTGLVLLATVIVTVRRMLASPAVTLQSIYAALSTFLIIGLVFAASCAAMDGLGGVPSFEPGDSKTFQYFSFTG